MLRVTSCSFPCHANTLTLSMLRSSAYSYVHRKLMRDAGGSHHTVRRDTTAGALRYVCSRAPLTCAGERMRVRHPRLLEQRPSLAARPARLDEQRAHYLRPHSGGPVPRYRRMPQFACLVHITGDARTRVTTRCDIAQGGYSSTLACAKVYVLCIFCAALTDLYIRHASAATGAFVGISSGRSPSPRRPQE